MGLFDDDFYSTKVSRRASRTARKEEFGFSRRSRKWSSARIALVSSLSSSVAVVLLFGAFYGGGALPAALSSKPASGVVQTLDPLERPIAASAKVRPAVVSIINEQSMSFGLGGASEQGQQGGVLREAGVGSGVIIDKRDGKAIIITNFHVIDKAASVKAVLVNGERREAKVVGKDQITDLAVLEIDAKGIDTVAEIGDSSTLQAAEYVIAIGNPLGLGDSVSSGIISKTKQTVPVSLNQDGFYDWETEVIQINASINQGNSGGPLIDLDGRVVGINSMKIADFGVEGIGFAIPINTAMPIIEQLLEQGYVPRPYLGVYTLDLEQYWEQKALSESFGGGSGQAEAEDGSGASSGEEPQAPSAELEPGIADLQLPDEVYDGVIVLEATGPAGEAGLAFNDVIVKLDGKAIGSTMELRKYLYQQKKIGDKIEITYYRGGKLHDVTLKLGDKGNEE